MNINYVKRAEWRWVIFFSVTVLFISFLPHIFVLLSGGISNELWFSGILHDHFNGAVYLSKIQQGMQGHWLTQFQHTGEPHPQLLLYPVYAVLGQIARVALLSPVMVFHLARICAGFLMFAALYQLGATIWVKVRARRIFFVITSIGSGFGWVLAALQQGPLPDVSTAQYYPFYAYLESVHLPLTIAAQSIMIAVFIQALRPGNDAYPSAQNGGVTAALMAVAIVFLQPSTLLALLIGFSICVIIRWFNRQHASRRDVIWFSWVFVPPLPVLVYYVLLVRYNPVVYEWLMQRVTDPPDLVMLALGFGIPLIIAIPGIYRGIRRFEPDGDRFMLVLLLVMVAGIYLLPLISRDFATGLMIPIGYFAARASEDFWFVRLHRRMQFRLFAASIPIISTSYLIVMLLPVLVINMGRSADNAIAIPADYQRAYEWLAPRVQPDDVIVASPQASLWLPSDIDARVFVGHPAETLHYQQKLDLVTEWLTGSDAFTCAELFGTHGSSSETYTLQYALIGPYERAYSDAVPCLDETTRLTSLGAVDVYAVTSDVSGR